MTNIVTFPGLGLEFHLDRVAFSLFGHPVYWYGVIIGCGFLLAVLLCCRWAPRFGVNSDQIMDLLIFAVPLSVVGLRVYYVLFYLDLYREADGSLNWGAIFRITDGGLAIYGGIIAAALTLIVFCRIRKISFFSFADLGIHGLLIGQCIGRWGNFMNVEAYGGTTTLPWRMCADSIAAEMLTKGYVDQEGYEAILSGALGVHPTFFYESAWNFVGLILVYFLGKKWRRYDGECFLFYLAWYGLGRAWIEGLRTDSLYLFVGSSIRVSQLLAAVSAVAAGVVLVWMLRRAKAHPQMLYVNKLAAQAAQAAPAAEPPQAEREQAEEGEPEASAPDEKKEE